MVYMLMIMTCLQTFVNVLQMMEENIAKVVLTKDVADDVLIKAIVDEGYEVK
mgnify:CR=1 FL=1